MHSNCTQYIATSHQLLRRNYLRRSCTTKTRWLLAFIQTSTIHTIHRQLRIDSKHERLDHNITAPDTGRTCYPLFIISETYVPTKTHAGTHVLLSSYHLHNPKPITLSRHKRRCGMKSKQEKRLCRTDVVPILESALSTCFPQIDLELRILIETFNETS